MGLRRVKEVKNNKSRKQRLVPGKPTWACQLAFTEVKCQFNFPPTDSWDSHRAWEISSLSSFRCWLEQTVNSLGILSFLRQTLSLKGNGGHPRDAALSYFNVFPTFLSFPGGSVVKNPPSTQDPEGARSLEGPSLNLMPVTGQHQILPEESSQLGAERDPMYPLM